MFFLKITTYEDMCLIFSGNNIDSNLITVFFADYEEMVRTASSLIDAGAVVIMGRAEEK